MRDHRLLAGTIPEPPPSNRQRDQHDKTKRKHDRASSEALGVTVNGNTHSTKGFRHGRSASPNTRRRRCRPDRRCHQYRRDVVPPDLHVGTPSKAGPTRRCLPESRSREPMSPRLTPTKNAHQLESVHYCQPPAALPALVRSGSAVGSRGPHLRRLAVAPELRRCKLSHRCHRAFVSNGCFFALWGRSRAALY
jgi:hypothetical protein